MRNLGLVPNVITYSALISACAKGHKGSKGLGALPGDTCPRPGARRPHLQRLVPYLRQGPRTAERALELFQVLRVQGLVPHVITYSALLSAGEKGKRAERALEVF